MASTGERAINGLRFAVLDYHVMRHKVDIEAIYTYEGTEHTRGLIVGRNITGVKAFS
jgi:glutaryl-CoA dehydrogenase